MNIPSSSIPKFLLTYNFHVYTIHFEEKEVVQKCVGYTKFEDLLADYRSKKSALFCNVIEYNTDFKVYTVNVTEQDITKLDVML